MNDLYFNFSQYPEDDDNNNKVQKIINAISSATLAFLIVYIVMSLLTSCKTTKVTAELKDSISVVSSHVSDSVKTVYSVKTTDRFVDRYINNTYVVTPLGDTIKAQEKQYVYVYDNSTEKDSIAILKNAIDSLSHLERSSIVVTQEKELTTTDKMKIYTYDFILVSLFFILALVGRYLYNTYKK